MCDGETQDESGYTPKKNGYTCTKCQTWACSAECERAVVSMHCCRLTGVVSLGRSQSSCSEGPGGSAASRLVSRRTDGQAIDVQMAEVQDDRHVWDECGPPGCAAAGARRDRSANAD